MVADDGNQRGVLRRVWVVGGCHLDVLGRPDGVFEMATSCPGHVATKAGGVARNVAVLLGRSGVAVRFHSVVGGDGAGRMLLEELTAAGVDASGVQTLPDRRTGTYLAIHDGEGEMVAAVSDLGLYDEFRFVAGSRDEPTLVFADCNIPEGELVRLAELYGERLVVDAVSRAKVAKVLPLFRRGALIVCNLVTASALAGRELGSSREAIDALVSMGAQRLLVTAGSRTLSGMAGGELFSLTPDPVHVVDVTGTGDAQNAGLLLGLLGGHDLRQSVLLGMRAARAALGHVGALDRLPGDVVEAALGNGAQG